ncbi:MAG: NERD domain-containing protein, partial [Paludibacter sp.]|nr:NERD domain-containing protein [Paludibacter sp.]
MWVIIGFFIIISFSVFLNIYLKIKDKNLLETVTKSYRGTKSEKRLVLRLLKYGIPAEDIFHDLYLEKSNNNYSQIDLVIITNVGIIVFEVKDYSGWLFGKGNQDKWTQVLAYG